MTENDGRKPPKRPGALVYSPYPAEHADQISRQMRLTQAGWSMRFGVICQLLTGLAVLTVCVAAPGHDSNVLLIPLGKANALGGLEHSNVEWRLVGSGKLAGSMIVRVDGALPYGALLRRAIVPVAVPVELCGKSSGRPPALPAFNPARTRTDND